MTDEPTTTRKLATDTVGERTLSAADSHTLELVDLEGPTRSNGHAGEPIADELALHEPRLTLGQAARATGISKDALRRRLRAGVLPNASRTVGGAWRVPVTDLLGAGLELSSGNGNPTELAVGPVHHLVSIESLQAEVERLRNENAMLRERMAVSETIAFERQEHIQDLRLALRMLPDVWAEQMHSSNHAYWGRQSAAPTPPLEAGESAAKIKGLTLALEAERAENDRLTAQLRRRWWPFRKALGKHGRRIKAPPT